MSDDFRHHRAGRDRIIIVPVPYEAGSPKQKFMPPPGEYKRDQPEHWRPAQRPPSKAQKVRNLLDGITRSDQAAREFMDAARRASWEQRKAREQVEA